MKRILAMVVVLLYTIHLTACCIPEQNGEKLPSFPQQTEPAPETDPVTEPPETKPEHSELYIPGVPVDDVLMYFNEVCLDAEMTFGGDPSRLQKWAVPIYYQINGDPTPEDMAILTGFANWLNSVEGFPGIYESADNFQTNMRIYFCSQEEMLNQMGDSFADMDGGVTFWYDNDKIYDCIICYRTDLPQFLRNSVILEEIYNGLGPIQDTSLRADSIIYSEYSEPQSLTQMDQLLLKLLYHPDMRCGMNTAECENIIRRLYY